MRRQPVLILLLIGLAMLLSACAGSGPNGPQPEAPLQTSTSSAPGPDSTQPAIDAALTPGPTPLTGDGPWPIALETADNTRLSGMLYGKGATGIILAPQYPGGKEGWDAFGQTLSGKGYRALAFDFRGYGASQGSNDAAKAPDDLNAAIRFIKNSGSTQIVMIGAGLGGMAAIKVGSGDDSIKGVVVISSARSFEGLEIADSDLSALSSPSLWLAARYDMTQKVEEMYALAGSGSKDMWIYDGSSVQGTYILEGADGPDMQRRLLEFIAKVIAG